MKTEGIFQNCLLFLDPKSYLRFSCTLNDITTTLFRLYHTTAINDSKIMVPSNTNINFSQNFCLVRTGFHFTPTFNVQTLAKALLWFHDKVGKGHWQNHKLENMCLNVATDTTIRQFGLSTSTPDIPVPAYPILWLN